jgi:hypothetical protein
MAGDWIKVQKDTPDKPEVLAVAARLGIDPDAVTGKLIRIWSWFDTHTTDGNALSVTFSFIDRMTGVTGFAEQVAMVGWLEQNGAMLTLPNFQNHNGETAKKRAQGKNRTEKHRSNAESNAPSVTKASPEKRREEKNTNTLFDVFWTAYPNKVGKDAAKRAFDRRKPDDELFGQMMNALENQKTSDKWTKDNGQYIPNPATWLNQGRWKDESESNSQPSLLAGGI